MNMNRALVKSAVFCAFFLAAAANAGSASNSPVVVYGGGTGVTGSLISARNSSDSTQYIECTSEASSVSNQAVAQCMARDAAGTSFSCSSTDPKIIAVVQSISESSLVTVESDGNGKCLHVFVANSSRYLP